MSGKIIKIIHDKRSESFHVSHDKLSKQLLLDTFKVRGVLKYEYEGVEVSCVSDDKDFCLRALSANILDYKYKGKMS